MIFENNDKIIFAGDSVTDMGSVNPMSDNGGESLGLGYVRVIHNMLAAYYPELTLRIVNSGVSGNTSRHLLERYDRDVASQNPDWVSICIGINDVWRQFDRPALTEIAVGPEEYESNVESMISAVKDKVKGIFILAPYYMEESTEDTMRRRMDEYGAICKKLAEKHGCTFIDMQDMYNKYFRHKHPMYIASDRVHPNQVGAMLMAREFLKHCGFDANH